MAESHDHGESVQGSGLVYGSLPLNTDGLNVRILELLPGASADPIACRLVVRRLTGVSRFEALSYTWGSTETAATITANGSSLNVTTNLEEALRHLRRKSRRRRLWVDAICINQNDPDERATQVMQMGQIYRNADHVLIWLGPGDCNTDVALAYVSWCAGRHDGRFRGALEQCACCPYHWKTWCGQRDDFPGFTCPTCDISCRCEACLRVRDAITAGLTYILSRAWWDRIWVVQEVAMAAGDPFVGCESSWIPWNDLVRLEASGNIWPGRREAILHLNEIRYNVKKPQRLRNDTGPSTHSRKPDDIFQWLRKTSRFQAINPLDKVYGLLGMTRIRRWREFRPDYSASMQDLIYTLVLENALVDKTLDILTLCRPKPNPPLDMSQSVSSAQHMPSWFPDLKDEGLPYLATLGHLSETSPLRSLAQRLSATVAGSDGIGNLHLLGRKDGMGLIQDTVTPLLSLGLDVLSKLSLRVSGFRVDSVGAFSDEHARLMETGRLGSTRQALYFTSPVWRALDPVCLRTGDETDIDTFIGDIVVSLNFNTSMEASCGCYGPKDTRSSRERAAVKTATVMPMTTSL